MAGRYDRVSGALEKVRKRYDRISGAWTPVKKRFDKVNGVWVLSYQGSDCKAASYYRDDGYVFGKINETGGINFPYFDVGTNGGSIIGIIKFTLPAPISFNNGDTVVQLKSTSWHSDNADFKLYITVPGTFSQDSDYFYAEINEVYSHYGTNDFAFIARSGAFNNITEFSLAIKEAGGQSQFTVPDGGMYIMGQQINQVEVLPNIHN